MSYVNNTAEYKYPTDILAWNVLSDLVKRANMGPRLVSRVKKEAAKQDNDVYPQ